MPQSRRIHAWGVTTAAGRGIAVLMILLTAASPTTVAAVRCSSRCLIAVGILSSRSAMSSSSLFGTSTCRSIPAAAIFGRRGSTGNDDTHQQHDDNSKKDPSQQQVVPPPPLSRPPPRVPFGRPEVNGENGLSTTVIPPPPPKRDSDPPPPPLPTATPDDGPNATTTAEADMAAGSSNDATAPLLPLTESVPLPPPPPQVDEHQAWAAQQPPFLPPVPSAQQFAPAPIYPNGWGYQQEQYYNNQYHLERELDLSVRHQQELLMQTHNLTDTILQLEQREELHLRQLDVLTERLCQVEAASAHDSNQLLEYQANCTELGRQIAALQREIDEWQSQCQSYVERMEQAQYDMKKLTKENKAMSRKAHDLAALIELHRLEDEAYQEQSRRRKKSSGGRGFFAWLFGIKSSEDLDEDDDDKTELYGEARSTLLQALQNERNSVHELESMVTSLQQNNSAIAEQVSSRDLIVDELNDRVAVFEEDKIVLKAALKQLQLEMKQEQPKTQQLIDELEAAQDRVEELQDERDDLIAAHEQELETLREALLVKQDAIQQTESNLTMIGTYVDRLESRLADFAVQRRDLSVREQKCAELEQAANASRAESDALKTRVQELQGEQNEVKTLLKEMADERTKLQTQLKQFESEKQQKTLEDERLRGLLRTLQAEYDTYKSSQDSELESRLAEMENQASANLLQARQQSDSKVETLMQELGAKSNETIELQEQLKSSRQSQSRLDEEIARLKDQLEFLRTEAANATLSATQQRLKEIQIHLNGPEPGVDVATLIRSASSLQESTFLYPLGKSKSQDAKQTHKTERPQPQHTPTPPNSRHRAGKLPLRQQPQQRAAATPGQRQPQMAAPPNRGSLSPRPNAVNRTRVSPNRTTLPPRRPPISTKKPEKRFRKVRKTFAKYTGLHGFFGTKKSVPQQQRPRNAPPPWPQQGSTTTPLLNNTAAVNRTATQQHPEQSREAKTIPPALRTQDKPPPLRSSMPDEQRGPPPRQRSPPARQQQPQWSPRQPPQPTQPPQQQWKNPFQLLNPSQGGGQK